MDVFHAVLLMALVAAVIGWWYQRQRRIEAETRTNFWIGHSDRWSDEALDSRRKLGELLQYKGAARDYSLLQKKRAKQK